jgi:hypothetical protein
LLLYLFTRRVAKLTGNYKRHTTVNNPFTEL